MGNVVRLLALACLLTALSVPTAPSQAKEPHAQRADLSAGTPVALGFTDGLGILALSRKDLDRQLDAVVRAGGSWLRVPVPWYLVESQRGEFRWSELDRVVDEAREHGLQVLANIAYSPRWARPAGTTHTAPPRRPRLYGDFVSRVVQRYRGAIRHWEIWNEPNVDKFFGGPATHADAPETYTRLLRAAYRSIKQVQPRSTVVAGALSSRRDGLSSYSMPTFLRRMYAAGAGRYLDAASLHPYIYAGAFVTDRRRVYGDVAEARRIMERNGDAGKQVWFTEMGHATYVGGPSEAQQRDLVISELRAAASLDYAGPTFLYSIRDHGRNPLLASQNFGALLTHDWQPKLLYQALAEYAARR